MKKVINNIDYVCEIDGYNKIKIPFQDCYYIVEIIEEENVKCLYSVCLFDKSEVLLDNKKYTRIGNINKYIKKMNNMLGL